MWRLRAGENPVELRNGDTITITHGDRLALGTGVEDSGVARFATLEDAQRRLCWKFLFADTGALSGDPEAMDSVRNDINRALNMASAPAADDDAVVRDQIA